LACPSGHFTSCYLDTTYDISLFVVCSVHPAICGALSFAVRRLRRRLMSQVSGTPALTAGTPVRSNAAAQTGGILVFCTNAAKNGALLVRGAGRSRSGMAVALLLAELGSSFGSPGERRNEQTICYRNQAVSAQKKLVSAARRAPHLERGGRRGVWRNGLAPCRRFQPAG
jgi:hypothetical protein